MKKDDLIKALQEIDGNPEIFVWNGFVDDVMPIGDLLEDALYKECKSFITESVTAYICKINNTFDVSDDMQKEIDSIVKNRLKNDKYELANPYVQEDEMKVWYGKNKKKIVIINPKCTGKNTWDRNGEISY